MENSYLFVISKTSENFNRNRFRIFNPFEVSNKNLFIKFVSDVKYTAPSDDNRAPRCNDIRSEGPTDNRLPHAIPNEPIVNAREK